MTCEIEILKFLKGQELPSSEVPLAYREEDCAYLVIKTIEELQELNKNLKYETKDLIEILQALGEENLELRTKLKDLQDEKDNAITRLQEEREGNNYA